jgi:DNA helicase HerA-like ATPase
VPGVRMIEKKIEIEDIKISNATQRTVSIIGGKGTGKTTFLKMLLDHETPVLCFDPLNVIKGKNINAHRINLKIKDADEDRIKLMMEVVNKSLKKDQNLILSFNNMIGDEEIILNDLILPEFAPLHGGSIETERYIRHCRNHNVGIIMTSQRPASVKKNVLALTDYLILFRLTWTHDIQAVKDLLKDICSKEELKVILKTLPTLKFMEGYVIDYRKEDIPETSR